MEEEILIDELNISEKVKKVLKKLGFKYINEFEEINLRNLEELKELGERYIIQLEETLYSLGIDVVYDEETLNRCKEWRKTQGVNNTLKNNKEEKGKNSTSMEKGKKQNGWEREG